MFNTFISSALEPANSWKADADESPNGCEAFEESALTAGRSEIFSGANLTDPGASQESLAGILAVKAPSPAEESVLAQVATGVGTGISEFISDVQGTQAAVLRCSPLAWLGPSNNNPASECGTGDVAAAVIRRTADRVDELGDVAKAPTLAKAGEWLVGDSVDIAKSAVGWATKQITTAGTDKNGNGHVADDVAQDVTAGAALLLTGRLAYKAAPELLGTSRWAAGHASEAAARTYHIADKALEPLDRIDAFITDAVVHTTEAMTRPLNMAALKLQHKAYVAAENWLAPRLADPTSFVARAASVATQGGEVLTSGFQEASAAWERLTPSFANTSFDGVATLVKQTYEAASAATPEAQKWLWRSKWLLPEEVVRSVATGTAKVYVNNSDAVAPFNVYSAAGHESSNTCFEFGALTLCGYAIGPVMRGPYPFTDNPALPGVGIGNSEPGNTTGPRLLSYSEPLLRLSGANAGIGVQFGTHKYWTGGWTSWSVGHTQLVGQRSIALDRGALPGWTGELQTTLVRPQVTGGVFVGELGLVGSTSWPITLGSVADRSQPEWPVWGAFANRHVLVGSPIAQHRSESRYMAPNPSAHKSEPTGGIPLFEYLGWHPKSNATPAGTRTDKAYLDWRSSPTDDGPPPLLPN